MCPVGQHERIADTERCRREDWRSFVYHSGVVHQQHRSGIVKCKAARTASIRRGHASLSTTDPTAPHEYDCDKIDTIPMGALGRGSTDPVRRINAKLMCFDEPVFDRVHLCEQLPDVAEQVRPRRGTADLRFDGLEQTVNSTVQGIVLSRLPVRSMWHGGELPGVRILDEATMPPKAVVAAVAKVPISR